MQLWRERAEVILAEPADEERPGDDVLDFARLVPDGSVVGQAIDLALLVAYESNRVVEEICGLYVTADSGLQRPQV